MSTVCLLPGSGFLTCDVGSYTRLGCNRMTYVFLAAFLCDKNGATQLGVKECTSHRIDAFQKLQNNQLNADQTHK